MRQTHLAGEKLFVDYSGLTMPIYNQRTGEKDTAQIDIHLYTLLTAKNKKILSIPMYYVTISSKGYLE